MTLEILNPGDAAKDDEIAAFERSFDIGLPEDYKRFLKRHAGGRPVPDAFDFLDGTEGSMVDQLYYLDPKHDKYANLAKIRSVFNDVAPEALLMIGRDPGGNQICLFLSPDRYGQVGFWNHEYGSIESKEDLDKSVKIVAEDFQSFLDNLFDI